MVSQKTFQSIILFILAVIFMYAAFFAWHITGSANWEWSKFPTVMLLTVLSVVHLILGTIAATSKKEDDNVS